jgi:hypothetical protein
LGQSVLERKYQAKLKKTIMRRFPGSFIMKNDSSLTPGIPDLTVLWNGMWAMLEVKAYETAPHEPNQDWYIELFQTMSFGAFIYPENETAVLDALETKFQNCWDARVPEPQQLPLDRRRRR